MSEYLVVRVLEQDGSDININNVSLNSKANTMKFSDVTGRGMSLDLISVDKGNYVLKLDVANHPLLTFSLMIELHKGEKRIAFRGRSPAICSLSSQKVTLAGRSSDTLHVLSFRLARQHEEIILVAGWDYHGGADNTLYAKTWRNDLYQGSSSATRTPKPITRVIFDHTVVTLFDFKTGNRTRWIKGRKDWHEMDSVLQGSVATNLTDEKKRHDDDSISIVHVYDYLANLGVVASGSVKRLDIFSHSWAGGPIMVNTDEDSEYKSGGSKEDQRDPHDKDGRIKDFTPVNMPRHKDFRKAFSSGALAKIWGCFATNKYRALIRGAVKARDRTTPFTVVWTEEEGNKEVVKKEDVTVEQIENFFKNYIMKQNFMINLANTAGITVFGAPPGMGSNLIRVPPRKDYMYVKQSVYQLEFDWFKKTFGIVPDDTGYFPYK